MKPKIAICVGTRPDIIKMWPVHHALSQQDSFQIILIQSGQHDDLAKQALQTFNLAPDQVATVLEDDKLILGHLHSALVREFTNIFLEIKPDLVLVHGDTATAFAGACAAFQAKISIGHVEAGLRTSRFEKPFPEEAFRRAISRFTTLHFAPTAKSAQNLREEGINKNVFVTGNTVVDSLTYILRLSSDTPWRGDDKKRILVTCHRRESYGEPLVNLCKTLAELCREDREIIWPVHVNSNIKDTVHNLLDNTGVNLRPPIGYEEFVNLLHRADLCITDSGGVLEEAAVLGVPTIVLRTETERPETLTLDSIYLVGYNTEKLTEMAELWLDRPPRCEHSTMFGDGTAGIEITEIIKEYFTTMEKYEQNNTVEQDQVECGPPGE